MFHLIGRNARFRVFVLARCVLNAAEAAGNVIIPLVVLEITGAAALVSVGNACPATVEKRRSTEESSDGTRCKPSLTLATRRSGKCMEIHIKDNAGGGSPDTIEEMFNPFVATTPPVQGAGLGLPLPGKVMCRHGAEIRVKPCSST